MRTKLCAPDNPGADVSSNRSPIVGSALFRPLSDHRPQIFEAAAERGDRRRLDPDARADQRVPEPEIV